MSWRDRRGDATREGVADFDNGTDIFGFGFVVGIDPPLSPSPYDALVSLIDIRGETRRQEGRSFPKLNLSLSPLFPLSASVRVLFFFLFLIFSLASNPLAFSSIPQASLCSSRPLSPSLFHFPPSPSSSRSSSPLFAFPPFHHSINPILSFSTTSPNDRTQWYSQQNALRFVDPPYVYNVHRSDKQGFLNAVKEAIENPFEGQFIPEHMKENEMRKRVRVLVESDW